MLLGDLVLFLDQFVIMFLDLPQLFVFYLAFFLMLPKGLLHSLLGLLYLLLQQ